MVDKKQKLKKDKLLNRKFVGKVTAETTIHHGGNEKTGSTPVLRSIYMYNPGYGEVQLPYIHGNNIRGKLRRLLMKDFFDYIGVDTEEMDLKLFHCFFTGGVLESGKSSGTVDLKVRKKIKKFLPTLGLLGGAVGNQLLEGVLKVGHMFPVCQEYKFFLSQDLRKDERADVSVRRFTDESFQTRKDDRRKSKNEKDKDDQAHQMKVDYECFIPGTLFYHWFQLENATDVESSCFGRMMELFERSPFVAGKSSSGNGRVVFDYTPDTPSSKVYFDYLDKNKKNIKQLLGELEDIL